MSHCGCLTGGAPWDVPLELRCAVDANLTAWSTEPEYLFNVSWWRAIPYDPARPWRDTDGNWYVLLSMDGCNTTTKKLPCHEGGQLMMFSSPQLRGTGADWKKVGPVFTSNKTVLKDGFLSKEFVTIDFIGTLEGDTQDTKIFLNNVGGNGTILSLESFLAFISPCLLQVAETVAALVPRLGSPSRRKSQVHRSSWWRRGKAW